jgi:phenylpropionate dioxygenase-like ring-hydroxylating dioxygenase large terminal subunit
MALPAPGLVRAASAAMHQMAHRNTPFVMNEWYVVAFAAELQRSLLKRTVLGRRLVLFRTRAGKPVALDDRCAHRSYPLSSGALDGDTVICGYHGFRYDAAGDCIEVPSQKSCPRGIGVRSFPLLERGPFVWGWLGDAPAAAARIPSTPWLDSTEWVSSQGYFHLPGNYVSLHENLLDLTHLSFVHADSFGTPDYAGAPYESDLEEGHYRITRRVVPTQLPPVWAKPTRLEHDRAARIATSEFVSPGLHVVSVSFYDCDLPEGQRPEFRIRTSHVPTPETNGSTHYFIVHSRDFAQQDADVTAFMHEQLFEAFREDVDALTQLEEVLANPGSPFYEMSVASDAPSVAMRRYLRKRALAEQPTSPR